MKLLLFFTFLLAVSSASAHQSDDTLTFYLANSKLVVVGTIVSEPHGLIDHIGLPNYECNFKIHDVLKGDAKLVGQNIQINIVRHEMEEKDKSPLIRKGSECILFLKDTSPNKPYWETADYWFGIQSPSSTMIRSLIRLTEKNRKAEQGS